MPDISSRKIDLLACVNPFGVENSVSRVYNFSNAGKIKRKSA
jgi:hypothetical protein